MSLNCGLRNKLRLEDIDPKTAEGFPVLRSDGIGNMEPKEWNIPPGPGEGGVEKVVLDDSLKSKVTAAISEYGFNMVAAGMNLNIQALFCTQKSTWYLKIL